MPGWSPDFTRTPVPVPYHGFVWQNGALQTVDYPGAVYTYLFGVNNQGVAIGLYGDGTMEHAVMYSVGWHMDGPSRHSGLFGE